MNETDFIKIVNILFYSNSSDDKMDEIFSSLMAHQYV